MEERKYLKDRPGKIWIEIQKKKKIVYILAGVVVLLTAVLIFVYNYGQNNKNVDNYITQVQQGNGSRPEYSENGPDVITVGTGTITGEFDPVNAVAAGDKAVSGLIYESLLTLDRSGKPVVQMAGSYKISNDGKTFTFTIPEGIVFSNGKDLDLEDIARSITAGYGEYFVTEESIYMEGSSISFTFTDVDKDHIWIFLTGIQPAEMTEAGHEDKEYIGTAPYKLSDYGAEGKDKIILEPNEYYRGDIPKTGKVVLIEADAPSMAELFAGGQIDIGHYGSSSVGIEGAFKNNYTDVYTTSGSRMGYLGLNLENTFLDDLNVRKALAYAVDYEKILELYSGYADINPSPFPGSSWMTPDNLKPFYYDGEKSLNYLKKAGYEKVDGVLKKDGEPVILKLTTFSGQHAQNVLTLVKKNLEELGISCEISQSDYTDFYQQVYEKRDFDIYYGNWQHGIYDNIEERFGELGYGVNPEGWYPEELSDLVKRIGVETSQKKQTGIYYRIANLYHEQVPQIPLDSPRNFVITAGEVKGLELSSYLVPYWNIQDIVIEK